MDRNALMHGVLAPVITPFDENLEPDTLKLARPLAAGQQCGTALFGTNSEANSMSTEEKIALLERLVDEGLTS